MKWVVSFPCWGDFYRRQAVNGPLLSILEAVCEAGHRNHTLFVVNTDHPRSFHRLFDLYKIPVVYYSVPPNIDSVPNYKYMVFGAAHQQAIDLAEPGDRVAMMCGDMSVSSELFASADRIFDTKKRIIMAAASSTLTKAPILMPSRKLLEWSLDNLAPLCSDLYWKEGRGSFPWCVYFRHKHGVDFRGFHLHVVAVVKYRGLAFSGSTSDCGLSEQFPTDRVHVVTSPDEMSLVARYYPFSPPRPRNLFKVGQTSLVSWAIAMRENATARHLWHFSHQINLKGQPDPDNWKIGQQVIRRIEEIWRRQGRDVEPSHLSEAA